MFIQNLKSDTAAAIRDVLQMDIEIVNWHLGMTSYTIAIIGRFKVHISTDMGIIFQL